VNGDLLLVNKTLAQIFGYTSPKEFLASVRNVTDLYMDPKERSVMLERIKNEGFLDGVEIQFKRRDGKHIWIRIRARIIVGQSGETIYESFFTDITQRKIAEESLQKSEERFRMLVEQAGDSFFIHDYEGKILDVNKHACDSLGYRREELLQLRIKDIVESIKKEQFWEPLKPGQYVTFESIQRRKDQSTFPVEVRLGRLDIGNLKLLLSLVRDITERKKSEDELKKSFKEIKSLKNRLEEENIFLRQEIELRYRHEEIVGESMAIKKALSDGEKVAKEETCVLILGETGTGKELLARAIHNMSPRRGHSMIKVNCAALAASLIESELFGREKGAFTGAISRQIGRFEAANESTLFLDEIGDLPLELQAKLLRVLQDGALERLGSSRTIRVNVRVIAATNRNLEALVKEKRFRRDLYYRLNVFPITMPPLSERREDIPLLVWAFVKEFSSTMGKPIKRISRKDMKYLQQHAWPGNVRELRNFIERAMILSSGSTLKIDRSDDKDVDEKDVPEIQDSTLKELEKNHILHALEGTGWRVSGKGGAAEFLGLKESTLRYKMKKLGIERPGLAHNILRK
jgi:PAS domain S-box-containing protein